MLQKFQISTSPIDNLHQLQWNNKLAIAISRNYFNDKQFMSISYMHCIRNDNVYEYPLTVLASKSFPFMNELNRFIQRSVDTGLIVKWVEGIHYCTSTPKKPLYEYTEVTFDSLSGSLLLWIFMLATTLLAFITEIIAWRKVQAQNPARIWHYIEMMVNPIRYFLLKDRDYLFD